MIAEPALSDDKLSFLLEKLHARKGWDFRGYRKSSLKRCILRRMGIMAKSFPGYLRFLDTHPGEYDVLFHYITIKVSEFFRDPSTFWVIERDVLPRLLKEIEKRSRKKLRIWSCGCAKGEEPYSVAILVVKHIFAKYTPQSLKYCITSLPLEIKIFATDIDERALDAARKGIYPKEVLRNVNPYIRNIFFIREGPNYYKITPFLRNLVTFGVHNIISDIHLSHMDMILCRNLLIYFEKGLQEKVIEKFSYALNKGGYLVLGKSEILPGRFRDMFREVSRREKVYQKIYS